MSDELVVYISSISSNMEVKKHQSHIESILSSKKIEFKTIDVASGRELLTQMREIVGDEKSLAPQICRGTQYIGDYEAFQQAVEDENLQDFLKC